MRDPLAPFVARRGAAVLDGGLATELERRGLDLSDPLWSARALIEAPEMLEAIHRDYLDAGADVITTATYQATVPGLLARGLDERGAAELLRRGVSLAAGVRDEFARSAGMRPRPLVAASIGSYGAFLANGAEYRGGYGMTSGELAAWHRPRVRILEESGADLLAFETIPSLEEAEAIGTLLAERDGLPAWLSFSARDASSISDGSPVGQAIATAAKAPRVFAVGFNCVRPELIAPLLAAARRATDKTLVAYPNAGDAWNAATRRWIPRPGHADLAALAPFWRGAGAGLIGGCCRTTPDDVRAIAAAL